MENFIGYEKKVITKNVKIQLHIVRVREDEPASSVLQDLKNVPSTATISMVLRDTPERGIDEIIFEEDVDRY